MVYKESFMEIKLMITTLIFGVLAHKCDVTVPINTSTLPAKSNKLSMKMIEKGEII
jgi:hypothetical protein